MGRTNTVIRKVRAAGAWALATAALVAAISVLAGADLLSWPPVARAQAFVRAGDGGGSDDSLSLLRERLLLYERSFRPSTYDAPLRVPSPAADTSSAKGLSFEAHDTYAAPETVQGFRVQVLNTTSYDESSFMRNQLLTAFEAWWVYVIYEAPTYKVRIGDFATRLEAKTALEQIQARGFANAWLVPDKVVLHLPPRMPLASPIDTTSSTVK